MKMHHGYSRCRRRHYCTAALASPVTTFNDTLDTVFPRKREQQRALRHHSPRRVRRQQHRTRPQVEGTFFGIDNVGISGNTYTVQPGFSPTSGGDPTPSTNAWWNFDFSVDLGSRTLADTQVVLTIDFDGDAGVRP